MSKTMDNDYKLYAQVNELGADSLREERDRLLEELAMANKLWNQAESKLEEVMGSDRIGYKADPYPIIDALTAQVKLVQNDRDEQVDQVAKLEARVEELEKQPRNFYAKYLASVEKTNQLRAKVEELTREVDMYNGITLGEVVKERDDLLKYNKIWCDRAHKAADDVTELRILNGQQVFEIEEYASEVLELREKLASAECDLDTVDQENIYLDAQREVLQKRLDDAYSVISHLSAKPVGPVQELPKQPTVVKVVTFYVDHHESHPEFLDADAIDETDNLKLTFHDGKLVSAEVIGKESDDVK